MTGGDMRAAGILFDKDGTLFDFEATYAPATAGVVHSLASGGADARRLAEAVGFDLDVGRFDSGSIVIAGTAADMARAWGPLVGRAADSSFASHIDGLFEEHARQSMALFEDADPVLGRLSAAGFRIGLATNDAEENGRLHLRAANIDRHFSFIAGYDSGHGAKPLPGMVLAFAENCGVVPDRIVMVGDSVHDLQAAKACGAVAVGISTGLASAADLDPHADHVVASLGELLKLPMINLA
jgi:phosphoglycolate phosphatase